MLLLPRFIPLLLLLLLFSPLLLFWLLQLLLEHSSLSSSRLPLKPLELLSTFSLARVLWRLGTLLLLLLSSLLVSVLLLLFVAVNFTSLELLSPLHFAVVVVVGVVVVGLKDDSCSLLCSELIATLFLVMLWLW